MQLVHSWIIDEKLDAFFISIRVRNPITQKSIIKWCLFDTGFTGYLGLDKATLNELGLKHVGTGDAMTIAGKVSFTTYSGVIEIMKDATTTLKHVHAGDENVEDGNGSIVLIQELPIPMVGIKTIQEFNWLLVSEKKLLCLVDI
jgi:predicted aspartyl protease